MDRVSSPETSVLLVNTDAGMESLPRASSEKALRKNKFECWLVLHLVSELLAQGLSPSAIGVVTPYVQQYSALRDVFEPRHVDVFTMERCLGTVKDCVIVSCVKQNGNEAMIKDASRVHLAFSRARAKLIIIGSRNNLEHIETLKNYFMTIKKKGMAVNVGDMVAEKEYCNQHYTFKELKPLL